MKKRRFIIIVMIAILAIMTAMLSSCAYSSKETKKTAEVETKTGAISRVEVETQSKPELAPLNEAPAKAPTETETQPTVPETTTEPEVTTSEPETTPPETTPATTEPVTPPETTPAETEPTTIVPPETTPATTEPVTPPETTPAETEPTTIVPPETTPAATEPVTPPETTPVTVTLPKNREEMVQYAQSLGYTWKVYWIENTTVSLMGMPPEPIERSILVNNTSTYSIDLDYFPQNGENGFCIDVYSGVILDEQGRYTYTLDDIVAGVCYVTAERAMELIAKYK